MTCRGYDLSWVRLGDQPQKNGMSPDFLFTGTNLRGLESANLKKCTIKYFLIKLLES